MCYRLGCNKKAKWGLTEKDAIGRGKWPYTPTTKTQNPIFCTQKCAFQYAVSHVTDGYNIGMGLDWTWGCLDCGDGTSADECDKSQEKNWPDGTHYIQKATATTFVEQMDPDWVRGNWK